MATVISRIATSHGPQLMVDPSEWANLPARAGEGLPDRFDLDHHLTKDGMRANAARNTAALDYLKTHIERVNPDAIILVGDDQHENILDDLMPALSVYIGDSVLASPRPSIVGGDDIQSATQYPSRSDIAEALVHGLFDRNFDPAWSTHTRKDYGLGHAFGRPLQYITPLANYPIVPVMLNTYYPPTLRPSRCVSIGIAIHETIESMPTQDRVMVMASGGLSHTLIDESLDNKFMVALRNHDLEFMANMDPTQLVAGTSEIRNWIVAAACGSTGGRMVDYVPCYRTSKGVGCAMGFAVWE